MTAKATGISMMVLNAVVGALAASSASYCNTVMMRLPEIKNGI